MTSETEHPSPDDGGERRGHFHPANRNLGRVVACSGSHATISAVVTAGDSTLSELWSVGRLISISSGTSRIAALVNSMNSQSSAWSEVADNVMLIDVELVGEVATGADGRATFHTGIRNYPHLGSIAHRMRQSDLALIYQNHSDLPVTVGRLSQDETMDAAISIPMLLDRHFAVLGTTGVGKSTSVSLLINKAVEAEPNLRVLILDPHNEFAAAFPTKAVVIDTDTMSLPFWLFRMEELQEVIYRGRPGIPEEIDFLHEFVAEAKRVWKSEGAETALVKRGGERAGITADTPVPFRMIDLMKLIDDRLGKLEGKDDRPHLRNLKMRIMAAAGNPRFRFMFANNVVGDTLAEVIASIFRIPGGGRPITAFQLSGIPSDVVNAVASVLCRLAFEVGVAAGGAYRILVLCEEAHRYIPADAGTGFFPTRQAIARIAKEGRKYGVGLGVITQRPGELDPTILSQCSSVFAMRLTNDKDQDIIRSAISSSSASTIGFLSSLDNGEAIAFGEAIAVPMRMRFERLREDQLPRSASHDLGKARVGSVDVGSIVQRMRNIVTVDDFALGRAPGYSAALDDEAPEATEPPAMLYGSRGDPNFKAPPVKGPDAYHRSGEDRPSLLRRPLDPAAPPRSFAPPPRPPAPDPAPAADTGPRPDLSSLRQSLFGKTGR